MHFLRFQKKVLNFLIFFYEFLNYNLKRVNLYFPILGLSEDGNCDGYFLSQKPEIVEHWVVVQGGPPN
jgi:hypothetical protein